MLKSISSMELPIAYIPPKVKVIYINTEKDCKDYATKMLDEVRDSPYSWRAWGFDIEWTVVDRNVKRSPFRVGMIQFCKDDLVLLFHIAKCTLTPELEF